MIIELGNNGWIGFTDKQGTRENDADTIATAWLLWVKPSGLKLIIANNKVPAAYEV